ncbi:MAG TPA: hypothetical protein VL404_01015 [Candidatus Eisenbacteria bacterium]|jgi:peptidoglycan hydrolase CwlO-like protein|nr:hypothetical protein [Candidatus Eisenbacteria bacterium]
MGRRGWIAFLATAVTAIFGASLFLMHNSKESERKLRVQKELELSNRMVELTEKQTAISDLTKQKADLEDKLNARIAKLEETLRQSGDELKTHADRIDELSAENDSLKKDIQSKEKSIASLRQKIEQLENDKLDLLSSLQKAKEAQAAAPAEAADSSPEPAYGEGKAIPEIDPVKLGKIIVQHTSGRAAEIQHVDKVYGFVVINAGWHDGVREKTVLNIIRNKKLVGKAVVQKVRDRLSAAIVLPEWSKGDIEPGDIVSKY